MEMSNFITNSKTKKLKNRLNELITKSEELKFLVGFFYFSGIRELYESLQKNTSVALKVLVGLNIESTIHGILEYADNSIGFSDDERIYRLYNSIKKSINTEAFDNSEFYEQVRFFIEMIKQGRLLIRKTYEPNHAKLYIFKLQESQIARNSLFITGSCRGNS